MKLSRRHAHFICCRDVETITLSCASKSVFHHVGDARDPAQDPNSSVLPPFDDPSSTLSNS